MKKENRPIEFNINDKVEVMLTAFGLEVLKTSSQGMISYDFDFDMRKNLLSVSLWEFMNIFGEHCWNGQKQMFVKNTLTIQRRL